MSLTVSNTKHHSLINEDTVQVNGKFHQMLIAQIGRAEIKEAAVNPIQPSRGELALQDYVRRLNIVGAGEIQILDVDLVNGSI